MKSNIAPKLSLDVLITQNPLASSHISAVVYQIESRCEKTSTKLNFAAILLFYSYNRLFDEKFDFSPKMFRSKSNHVQWILSASRDRKIILWKLIDGKIMSKCDYPPVKILDKPQKIIKQKK